MRRLLKSAKSASSARIRDSDDNAIHNPEIIVHIVVGNRMMPPRIRFSIYIIYGFEHRINRPKKCRQIG